ncbi:MAG: tetratricopeptide repeat protein [Myxococcota bacterium]
MPALVGETERGEDVPTRDLESAAGGAIASDVAGQTLSAVGGRPNASPEPSFGIGDSVGRYLLLANLGRGGMGWVMRALDTELQREVAIKLLQRALESTARQRLMREARAMAQLSHPNVVPVYDVGEHAGVVFVAMEMVQGRTLSSWLRASSRRWQDVVEHFLAAGEGLAAAHRMGLVHRDFKPANVMVGDDGRVRVLDFGLARPIDESSSVGVDFGPELRSSADRELVSSSSSIDVGSASLTQTGLVLGTPAYMAPEQFVFGVPEARSDQYAFCVSLWEGLYGERPFQGRDHAKLRAAKATLPEPPKQPVGPPTLTRVLMQGLAPRPADRFASMEDLLAALRRTRRARPLGAGLAVAGAALVLVGLGVAVASRRPTHDPCADAETKLDGVWDEQRRAAVGDTLRGLDLSYTQATADAVERRLDDYAQRWNDGYAQACQANTEQAESSVGFDRSMDCLERRRTEMRALVDVLGSADAVVSRDAIAATGRLTPIDPCLGPDAGEGERAVPADPGLAAEVSMLRDELAAARAMQYAARYDEARTRAAGVVERAQTLGFAPLSAEARFELGRALHHLARFDDAEAEFEAAYALAVEHGLDELAARVALSRVNLANNRHRIEAAAHWLAQARARVDRLGAQRGRLGVRLRQEAASLANERADFDEALRLLREALTLAADNELGDLQRGSIRRELAWALRNQNHLPEAMEQFQLARALIEGVVGPDHPEVVSSLQSIADIQLELGDSESALALIGRSLRILEESFGPRHPEVASCHSRLGIAHRKLGDYETSAEHYQRALEIIDANEQEDSLGLADVLNNHAIVLAELGRFDEAIRSLERAQSIFITIMGEEHPRVAVADGNIAQIHRRALRPEQALLRFEVALKRMSASFGDDHPNTAMTLSNMALAKIELEDYEGAAHDDTRALAILEQGLGPDHPHLSFALFGLGCARTALGDPTGARQALERALRLRESGTMAPETIAEAQAKLAEALWPDPEQRGRALELARTARATYLERDMERGEGSPLTEVEQWLRSVGHAPG